MMTIDMQRMSREEKLKVMHALWEGNYSGQN
jgi:hypothetical protein